MTATLRPSDGDAVHAALRSLRTSSGLPVLFAGECDGTRAPLTRFIGTRTDAMEGLSVERGHGLGGRVIASGRPAAVRDYQSCEVITPHYRQAVDREGLRSVVSVPVIVAGVARAVLYGSARVASQIGDQVTGVFRAAAADLASEFEVRDEVDRRVRMAHVARAEQRHGLESSDREQLRALHGELRAIAAAVQDPTLRERLLAAGTALAGVGLREATPEDVVRAPVVALSPREVDVLTQVALGCSNAEVALRLSLSPETVKAYLRNIGTKLGTSSRMESVARARLLGVLP